MHRGYISIHRKIKESWIFDNSDYLKAWIVILMEVNHSDKKVLIEGELIECNRGESVNSMQTWSDVFGKRWTRQKVRTFFKLLEKDEKVNQQGLRKTTKLSVCNYDTYQSNQPRDNQQVNQQPTNSQPTDNQQITTNNNVNNNNNGITKPVELKFDPKKYADNIEWIDNNLWIEWIDHKKKVKGAITERALKANVKTLESFGKENSYFNIEKALEKNWKDFYLEENNLFNQPQQTAKRQLKHMDGNMVQIWITEKESTELHPEGSVDNPQMIVIKNQFYFNPFHEANN
jgi:hypothetical protein